MRNYRGLTKEGKWGYGWYIESKTNKRAYIVTSATGYDESPTEIEHLQTHGKIYIHEYYRVIPETVGQSTGLKDKNGVEIYEGDVVKIIHTSHQFCGMLGKVHYGGLSASFWITGFLGGTDHWIGEWVEIIGNKWEKPELL